MAGLNDILGEPTPSLEDVIGPASAEVPLTPKPSIRNKAAQAMVVSGQPEKVEEMFQTAMTEIEETGTSASTDNLMKFIEEESIEEGRDILLSILSDETIPVEQRKKISQEYFKGENHEITNILERRTVAGPGPEVESVAQEKVRMSAAEHFRKGAALGQEMQQQYKDANSKLDKNVLRNLSNVFELFVTPGEQNTQIFNILRGLQRARDEDVPFEPSDFVLSGTAIKQIREKIAVAPVDQRQEMYSAVYELINTYGGMLFDKKSDFLKLQLMQDIIMKGEYSEEDELVDNLFGILDSIPLIGGFFIAARARRQVNTLRRANDPIQWPEPASVFSAMNRNNPEMARLSYKAIDEDTVGDLTKNLAGEQVTREEVLSSSVLPQPYREGQVLARTVDIDRKSKEAVPGPIDPEIAKTVTEQGAIGLTQEEKLSAVGTVVHDFQDALQAVPSSNMDSVRREGNNVVINASYGGKEGGALHAEDLVSNVLNALKEYGITEQSLTILKNEGGMYEPVKLSQVRGVEGDYRVALEYSYPINASDITAWSDLPVSRLNFLDGYNFLQSNDHGTLTRTMFDFATLLDPVLSSGFNRAVDFTAGLQDKLLRMGETFSVPFKQLKGERREKLYRYMKEANKDGIAFNETNLRARDFSNNEIGILRNWREMWDTHYHLKNSLLARSLDADGFMDLASKEGNRLFVKPVTDPKKKIVKAYDPETDEIVILSDRGREMMDAQGGTFVRLKDHMTIKGETIEHAVILSNSENKLKKISGSTPVTKYRNGYYEVSYRDGKFIVVNGVASNGKKYSKAVGVASSHKKANEELRKMAHAAGVDVDDATALREFGHVKLDSRTNRVSGRDYWDAEFSAGNIHQKHRGKELVDLTTPTVLGDDRFMLDPVESFVRATKSLSNRVGMYDMINTSKARLLDTFSEVLPRDEFGRVRLPVHQKEITNQENPKLNKKTRDARTTWEYINYMEYGYVNSWDDTYKAIFNEWGRLAGQLTNSASVEAGFEMVSKRPPLQTGKNVAFQALIAGNAARQFLLQSHQGITLLGAHPVHAVAAMSDVTKFLTSRLAGEAKLAPQKLRKTSERPGDTSADRAKDVRRSEIDNEAELVKFIHDGGLTKAVSNLSEEALMSLINETTKRGKAVKAGVDLVSLPLTISRKVGFEAGEQLALVIAQLTFRRAAIAKGKNMDNLDDRAEVYAQARHFMGNMNKAGDLPYNKNGASLLMQFMSAPHKAFLQPFNKALTPEIRRSATLFNLILFGGIPAGAAELWFGDSLPDPQTVEGAKSREIMINGLEQTMLNTMLVEGMGLPKEARVDISSLRPNNPAGIYEILYTLLDGGGIYEALLSTPSVAMIAGNNPRIANALNDIARWALPATNEEVDPITDWKAAISAASVFSQASNIAKANRIMDLHTTMYSNLPIPEAAVKFQAAVAAFGFNSFEDAQEFKFRRFLQNTDKQQKEDVTMATKEVIRRMRTNGYEPDEYLFNQSIFREIYKMYPNDVIKTQRIISGIMRREVLQSGQDTILDQAMEHIGFFKNTDEIKGQVLNSRATDEEKKRFIEILDGVSE